jgi:hypothetical protein
MSSLDIQVGGIEDLKKARHYLDMLIEFEQDEPAVDPLDIRPA